MYDFGSFWGVSICDWYFQCKSCLYLDSVYILWCCILTLSYQLCCWAHFPNATCSHHRWNDLNNASDWFLNDLAIQLHTIDQWWAICQLYSWWNLRYLKRSFLFSSLHDDGFPCIRIFKCNRNQRRAEAHWVQSKEAQNKSIFRCCLRWWGFKRKHGQ